MWNDEEDNNPYGSFAQGHSDLSDSHHSHPADNRLDTGYRSSPSPPSSGRSSPPAYLTQADERRGRTGRGDFDDDDEEEAQNQATATKPRKQGGYDSRVEQILYENPDLQILITDAGKSGDGGGGYIVYTIRTGDVEVRRRYSEFASLRQTLVNMHPTLVIPPIPEKHSMADYASRPTKAKEDVAIIELRKRMLAVFLNRCRKMDDVREDGVWWRFLDPKASWKEVISSPPVVAIPKNNMQAPPLTPWKPTPAHQWLPIPSSSAKLRSSTATSSSGTPTGGVSAISDDQSSKSAPRFPSSSSSLTEAELDPYFANFETSTRELELLLQGNIERVNRRTLDHLGTLSSNFSDLGARYNAFSLQEQSLSVAAAIEKVGQAVDSSFMATQELSSNLGASFAEPMREFAQFAGVVRSVLRYRILKRIQEEMTKDDMNKKRALLASLEQSETEAKRIEQHLAGMGSTQGTASYYASHQGRQDESGISRSTSNASTKSVSSRQNDSESHDPPYSPPADEPRKSSGGNFSNKIFGRISHAVHGIVDVDPERTRRDQMGKTKESLAHLEEAIGVVEQDVKDASSSVMKDLKRFQTDKEDDLRRYMIAYAKCHIEWGKKNLEAWKAAQEEVSHIDTR